MILLGEGFVPRTRGRLARKAWDHENEWEASLICQVVAGWTWLRFSYLSRTLHQLTLFLSVPQPPIWTNKTKPSLLTRGSVHQQGVYNFTSSAKHDLQFSPRDLLWKTGHKDGVGLFSEVENVIGICSPPLASFQIVRRKHSYSSLCYLMTKKTVLFKFFMSLHWCVVETFNIASWIGVCWEAKSSILLIFF